MANYDGKLKVYGRLTGANVLIPGSVRWGRTMPKNGHWVELIPVNYCCNFTTTTTTTAVPFECVTYGVSVERGQSGTYTYTPCGEVTPLGPVAIEGPVSLAMCTVTGEISSTGDVVITLLGECETTTTTTTVAPTTTTTTTETPTTTTTTTGG